MGVGVIGQSVGHSLCLPTEEGVIGQSVGHIVHQPTGLSLCSLLLVGRGFNEFGQFQGLPEAILSYHLS